MAGRGIAFYDQADSNGREIIVVFGGFQFPGEFFHIGDAYKLTTKEEGARYFRTTRTNGPREDERQAVYSRAPDGSARTDSKVFRKTFGPEGERNHNLEVHYLVTPEAIAEWLSDKPLYREGMGDRFRAAVWQRHRGLPIGVCTAWNEQSGLYLVKILNEEGIITPKEFMRAQRRDGFMRDYNLEKILNPGN